jgi:hypothetical protein
MVEHKIQSSTGLTLELEQVPKKLGLLTKVWAPHSFVVSFKLETDEAILFHKAMGAIQNYGVHLVVANILATRADVCYCVTSSSAVDSDAQTPTATAANEREVWEKGEEAPVPLQRHVHPIVKEQGQSLIEPRLVLHVASAHTAFREAHVAGSDTIKQSNGTPSSSTTVDASTRITNATEESREIVRKAVQEYVQACVVGSGDYTH